MVRLTYYLVCLQLISYICIAYMKSTFMKLGSIKAYFMHRLDKTMYRKRHGENGRITQIMTAATRDTAVTFKIKNKNI